MSSFDAQMEKIQAEESGPDHRPVHTAIALTAWSVGAARIARYDLLQAEPDGWLNLSELDEMSRDGYTVIAGEVTTADPDDHVAGISGALIRWRGGYFIAELLEGDSVPPEPRNGWETLPDNPTFSVNFEDGIATMVGCAYDPYEEDWTTDEQESLERSVSAFVGKTVTIDNWDQTMEGDQVGHVRYVEDDPA